MKTQNGKRPLSDIESAECAALKAIYTAKKKELNLTQDELGERLGGLGQSAVSHYLNGINALNPAVAAGFARELQVSVADFSRRLAEELAKFAAVADQNNLTPMLQPHREPREYPLISWVAAGERREASVSEPQGVADDWLPSTENAGPHGYWLKVKGKSMTRDSQPSFPEGTPILIRPEGFDVISGKFYIARHRETGETTFKQYVLDAGIGYLVPLNPKYQTVALDGAWEIIGRAIDAKITGM